MKKSIFFYLSVLLFPGLISFATTGCGVKINYLVKSIFDPISPNKFETDESESLTYYTFNTGNKEKPVMTIFFLPASGCTSLKYYLKPYFSGLIGNAKVYALQKRNVGHNRMGIRECDLNFHATNYFDQWVKDQKIFIERIVKDPAVKNGPIVILGVSEMGNVAALLATSIPAVTHLAILGSGGMKQIDELRLIAGRETNNEKIIDTAFAVISKDPDNFRKKIFGQTYKYWSSVAHINPLEFYLTLKIPILLGQGERDESAPVESAYYLQKIFIEAHKNNLTLLIYKDADHMLVDSTGESHRQEFLNYLLEWALRD